MQTRTAARWGFAIALAGVAAFALAADHAAVLGKWTIGMTFQEQQVEVTLEVTEAEGGGLAGTWTSPRGSDALIDVAWDGKELKFKRKLNRQGQEFSTDPRLRSGRHRSLASSPSATSPENEVQHSATVEGDAITGKMILPQREVPFSGKRAS